jgi:hypothetical protein
VNEEVLRTFNTPATLGIAQFARGLLIERYPAHVETVSLCCVE